jgi:hypothetical protein
MRDCSKQQAKDGPEKGMHTEKPPRKQLESLNKEMQMLGITSLSLLICNEFIV